MRHLLAFLSLGRPCFPDTLSAGDPVERHVYMELTIERLAGVARPLRVLEIGSWLGFSALTWAEALARRPEGGRVLCVDPWVPYHTPEDARTLEFPQRMDAALHADVPYHVFLHNVRTAPEAVTIDHLRGRSRDVLPYLRDGYFDVVYVDGSHYYLDVLDDLREAVRLTALGGILCGDDLERQIGESDAARGIEGVSEEEVLRDGGTDTKLLENDGFYHPGVTRAVAEVLGRVPCWDGFWAVERTADGVCDLALAPGEPFVPGHFGPGERLRIQAPAAAWTSPSPPPGSPT